MRHDRGIESSRSIGRWTWAGASVAALLTGSCPGVALAQAAAAAPQLEEVVVTAQRREENLQKVPITVTAIRGDVLGRAGVSNTQQLALLIPGLLGNTSSGAIIPVLRGIGVTSAQPGNDAPVANYIDGVFSPMNFQNTESLNNVERVEVLNGPQGTLFGRNASAGVVQVITKDPSPNTAADMAIGYGNYNTISGSFYGTTALAETLSANLAVVSSDQRDGFGRATTVNRDIFKVRATSAQAKVRWDASPDTSLIASLLWQERKDNNSAIAILPGTIGGVNGVRYQSNGFYNTLDDTYPYNNATKYMGYLKARHEASFFDVVNIAAYQYAKVKNVQDFDATPVPYLAWNLAPTEKTFTEELQILSKPDSPITWIVGAYYLHDTAHENQLQWGTLLGSASATSQVLADLETNSGAAYGQATIPFADKRANLTLGLRYTRDERQIVGTSYRNGAPVSQGDQKAHWPKVTYRLALDYSVTDEVLAYASYNRGFKSGTFTINSPTVPPVKPEVLDAYEVGFKAQLLDQRLRLNSAAFYYDYKNSQQRTRVGTSTFLRNAASATLYGLDVSFAAAVTETLSVNGGFELLHSEYSQFPNAITFVPNPGFTNTSVVRDVAGKDLVQAPPFSATLGGRYRAPLAGGEIAFGLNGKYTSHYYWEPSNRLKQKPTFILNGSATWTAPSKAWDVTLWMNNATDIQSSLFINDGYLGGDVHTPNPPRMYGVTLGVHL